MKNLFKKSSKKETTSTVQKLDKTQLEKVIGGAETSTQLTDAQAEENKKYLTRNGEFH